VALRQWQLTVPFPWRKRVAYDGALLGAVTRICVSTVLGFYRERLRKEGVTGGQSGAVVVVQRTSSDLKLHPHLHVLFLDGAYAERESGVSFTELPRLSTHEVGEVLARVVARIVKHLRWRGLLEALEGAGDADADDESDGLTALAASAASGRSPPPPGRSGGARRRRYARRSLPTNRDSGPGGQPRCRDRGQTST